MKTDTNRVTSEDFLERASLVETSPKNSDEIDLKELFSPVWAQRKLVATWMLAFAVVAAIVAFLLPNEYTSTTKIMTPQQAQSSATALLGQFSALAGLAGKDMGIKSPADIYVGILKSRSIADDIVKQFNLQSYYRARRLSEARTALEKHSEIEYGKDGLISIKVSSKSPQLSADLANAYVEQLYRANQRLAISEASQRRMFFEQQLEDEKNKLADAEVELKKIQESTGLIELSGQAEAMIRSAAQLQAQIAAKEVQLRTLESFATAENPDVIRAREELNGMRSQLSKLENDNHLGGGNVDIPTGKLPAAGLDYIRKLRDVKYHESLFEVLAKQYEAAKIDEGKSAPVVQVVDAAIQPDHKSGPPRVLIVVCGITMGLIVGFILSWIKSSSARASAAIL